MPDIQDLLRDAAPPPRGYDEGAVARRVAIRRRNRRAVAGVAAALVVVVGAVTATTILQEDDRPVRVTAEPSTTTTGHFAAYGATALAITGDQIWIGGDGFVARGDGSDRIEMPGPVAALAPGDPGLVWVRGDNFVAAVDTTASDPKVIGTWQGESADIVPLPSGEIAISLPTSDEVAIAKTSAIAELEEVWRIPVGDEPTDLVSTTGGDVWVRCGDGTISLLDVGAQGVSETEPWSGPLLAPSLGGGIWTTEGGRIIDLRPDLLGGGVSVAEGQRYDVDGTMAVETQTGLYVGGPAGLSWFAPGAATGQVLDTHEPEALAVSGGQVVYLLDGEVHETMGQSTGALTFCGAGRSWHESRPESYVGSPAHIEDIKRLQIVAPDDVRPAVDSYLEFLQSGGVDTYTNETAKWPAEVQQAVADIQAAIDDC